MKTLLIVCIFSVFSFAADAFEKHCVSCHTQVNVSLQKVFMDALLIYGGRENMKVGLAYYLRNPHKDNSVMSEEYINKNGIKEAISIDDKSLNEALDIYWRRYTIVGKLY